MMTTDISKEVVISRVLAKRWLIFPRRRQQICLLLLCFVKREFVEGDFSFNSDLVLVFKGSKHMYDVLVYVLKTGKVVAEV